MTNEDLYRKSEQGTSGSRRETIVWMDKNGNVKISVWRVGPRGAPKQEPVATFSVEEFTEICEIVKKTKSGHSQNAD